jgi:hypothetical protein
MGGFDDCGDSEKNEKNGKRKKETTLATKQAVS